jgi:transposase InsO family protein
VSRYRFIAVEKANHSVVLRCLLGVAKSAFYAWQRQQSSAHAQADERLTEQIRAIHDQSRCTYGAPRVHAELRKRGTRVARKRVARLMRAAKLVGRCPRRFRCTTIPDPTAQTPDLVQRQFRPAAPDVVWVADVTYVRTWGAGSIWRSSSTRSVGALSAGPWPILSTCHGWTTRRVHSGAYGPVRLPPFWLTHRNSTRQCCEDPLNPVSTPRSL